MTDLLLRARWDPGNLSSMVSSIAGAVGSAKNAMRGASMSSPGAITVPGLNISKLTSSLSAADRSIITSGQTYNKAVTGWITDIKRLDAAAAQGIKGYQGITFAGKGGVPSVYGTPSQTPVSRIPPAAGIGATRMGGIKERISSFSTGTWSTGVRDINAVNNAIKALIPAFRQLEQLEMRAAQWAAKSEMWRKTWTTARGQFAATQAGLRSQLGTKEAVFGGTPSQFLPNGTVIPGRLGAADASEAKAIAQSQTFRKLFRSQSQSGSMLRATLKTDGVFDVNKATEFVKGGITNPLGKGLKAATIMNPVMPQLLGDARGITKINAELTKTAAQILRIDAALSKLDQRTEKFQRRQEQIRTAITKRNTAQMAGFEKAFNTPAVPEGLNTLLGKYGSFRRDFISKMGIKAKYGTPGFAQELESRGITADISRDYSRGAYVVSGTARDKSGFEGTYGTAVSEKTGKSMEKWNGTMRNTQSFMRSLVVDFRKVIEWTLATTAVFGLLGIAIGSFTKINEINYDLQKFQITAKTTGEETTRAFQNIVQVAIATATPLKEMTAVMDDIALATRKVNQTTEDWLKGQQKLAQAVGILTNLTGLDTAKATDVLTSAYKQLGQGPADLIPMLNKLTAVGGGNASAITDIATALGGLATAAGAAGLSLDEQIASVQVLSQVTNKTAADTATAFKNLFGAINSRASEKMLKSFGIDIRDAAGNLRPFLDIYKDIYDARAKGIIQEGRYQDVLRAIAGGPRRAPDAAALLSNLPKIFESVNISADASNEALIANAKILDTNKAKMQQLKTSFDAALVEKFSDAVNKLTDILVTIGKVMTGVFGGLPDQLSSVILQMGLMVTAGLLLRKVFSILGSELRAFRTDIGNIGNASLPGSAIRGERALTTLPRIPVTTASMPRDVLVDRAGILRSKTIAGSLSEPRRQWTGTVNPYGIRYRDPGLHVPSGIPAQQPYIRRVIPNPVPLAYTRPSVGAALTATVQKPSVYAPLYKNIAVTGQQVSMVGKLAGDVKNAITSGVYSGIKNNLGKIGTVAAGAAGVAGGLALGAAGGSDATKLSNLTSLGMGAGGLLMMAGGPATMAAGAGLLGVSAILQGVAQDAIKAEERLKKTRIEVYDLSEAYLAQTKEIDFAKKAQEEVGQSYDALSRKTSRTTLENERLAQLQLEYASATVRVGAATEALNAVQQQFLKTLPKLGDKYQKLIDLINNGGLTPEKAGKISTNLAKDILVSSGNFGAPETPIENFFKTPTDIKTWQATQGFGGPIVKPLSPPRWAPPNINPLVYRDDRTQELIDKTGKGDWKALADALTGAMGYISPTNANRSELFSNAAYSLAAASPEDQATPQFAQAIALFGEFVAQFGDQTTRVSAAVSTYQAQVGAMGVTKGLVGKDLTRATSKGLLAGELGKIRGSLPQEATMFGGRAYGANPTIKQTDTLIQSLLSGDKKDSMSKDQAMEAYTIYAKTMGIYDDLVKRGVLEPAAVDWLKDMGAETEGLTDKVKGLRDQESELEDTLKRQRELRAAIMENYRSSAMDLGQQMLGLQAAFQGGDIKGPQYAGQMAQLQSYLALSRQLTAATRDEAEPALERLGDALGKVTGMYGMQFQSVEQLTGAIIGWGQALGLAPSKIREVMMAVLELNKQVILLQALRDAQVNIRIRIEKQTVTLEGESDYIKNRGTSESAANRKQQAEYMASIDALIAKIAAIGATGNPNAWKDAGGSKGGSKATTQAGALDIPQEWKDAGVDIKATLAQAVVNARKYQAQIPGESKKNAKDLVAIIDDNKRILLQKGIGEEYLRKAMDALTAEIKKQNDLLSKADMVSRIRIGAGDFAALANVPINSKSGISVGGEGNAMAVNVNINGQILTPAQMDQLANHIAAALRPKLV